MSSRMGRTTADDFEVPGGSATPGRGDGEYELLPEGTWLLEIESLEPFAGTKFGTNEPQPSVKINYLVVNDPMNGEWAGERIDQITALVKNMANPNAGLHKVWKAATGETPQEGVNYKLKVGLVGKRVMANVIHRVNGQGYTWPRITSLAPPPQAQPRQRGRAAPAAAQPAAPPPAADDDDDDDLAGA
jgi:hypothetical protein